MIGYNGIGILFIIIAWYHQWISSIDTMKNDAENKDIKGTPTSEGLMKPICANVIGSLECRN